MSNMITVATCSRSLFDFLPDKKSLKKDAGTRKRFLEENNLFGIEGGIPFLAGLLDGDGSCQVNIQKYYFHSVRPWRWSLIQSSYPFLVDFVEKFVNSLVPKSVTVTVRSNGPREAWIHKSGINALLDAGIARYSWKVAQWSQKMTEAQCKETNYYNTGQVARMFNVSGYIVRSWLKAGKLKYRRETVRTRKTGGLTLSRHYIPIEELEKFREKSPAEFMEERERVRRIKDKGVSLVNLAEMLNVSPDKLRYLYHCGQLAATLVRDELGHRRLVVPNDEIESLRKRKQKAKPLATRG